MLWLSCTVGAALQCTDMRKPEKQSAGDELNRAVHKICGWILAEGPNQVLAELRLGCLLVT